jgi:hypothetical protein
VNSRARRRSAIVRYTIDSVMPNRPKPLHHQRQHRTLTRCQLTKLLGLSGKTRNIDRHANTVASSGRSVHGCRPRVPRRARPAIVRMPRPEG